jgi:hypothetical protein
MRPPDEAIERIREKLLGHSVSAETRRKIGTANRGRKRSIETRAKMSASFKGRIFSAEHRKRLSRASTGKTLSIETRKKISETKKQQKLRGEHCPRWRGGLQTESYPREFRRITEEIRQRDGYLCRMPGCRYAGSFRKNPVHHIDYNKHNLSPENLITLCRPHHAQTSAGDRVAWELLLRDMNRDMDRTAEVRL